MKMESLLFLWNMTQQHRGTSSARVAAGVLLGLYNSARFPFPLDELRVLDRKSLMHALEVIANDAAHCQMEVHAWLDRYSGRTDFGERFEHLAHEYASFRRGRCKKIDLRDISPSRLVLTAQEAAHG